MHLHLKEEKVRWIEQSTGDFHLVEDEREGVLPWTERSERRRTERSVTAMARLVMVTFYGGIHRCDHMVWCRVLSV